jgi:hypothetical protein
MIPRDQKLAQLLKTNLLVFDQQVISLPGIHGPRDLNCFLAQLVDSIRRVKYVEVIREKPLSNIYIDANNRFFDPLKAASWHKKKGNIDEAFWLVFLLTHFGKNKKSGWRLLQEIYKGVDGKNWTWENIVKDFNDFRHWLQRNQDRLKFIGHFGNHRKYQSLDAYSKTGTGVAIGSYIEWVGPEGMHKLVISRAKEQAGNDPRQLFSFLFQSMDNIISFGRMGKFDFLTMIGKLGLAAIEPGSTYMQGATGPKAGARLLFGGNKNAQLPESMLNEYLNKLDKHLNLYFGMQVLEDALCNWQKSPGDYIYFKG